MDRSPHDGTLCPMDVESVEPETSTKAPSIAFLLQNTGIDRATSDLEAAPPLGDATKQDHCQCSRGQQKGAIAPSTLGGD